MTCPEGCDLRRAAEWFADIDEDRPEGDQFPWAAFVQVTGGVHRLEGIWFPSEEDCMQFIKGELI